MRIVTCGIDDLKMDSIRWKFGRAEYIDATKSYKDIMKLCADVVVVNIDNTPEDVVATIREYQEKTAGDKNIAYYYVSDDEMTEWFKEFYFDLYDAIASLDDCITEEEFEALHLFSIQKVEGGLIQGVSIDEGLFINE